MKIIHGAFFFAFSNKSRTRLAPTPTNISTKSEPLIEKNGAPASPATARASNVLPVPGGPTSKTPFGILDPICLNFLLSFKKSTISTSSCFSSSAPATSEKRTRRLLLSYIFALDLPKFIIRPPPPPPWAWLRKKINNKAMIKTGINVVKILTNTLCSSSSLTVNFNPSCFFAVSVIFCKSFSLLNNIVDE
ncbi:Uncharacterised protein [Streptococcus pneumoniae]|nr:Uncharacterised protein [Streptococcus pneumoniae]CRG02916.1 Uncharacterised protein [Streptococcus pneumoniae]